MEPAQISYIPSGESVECKSCNRLIFKVINMNQYCRSCDLYKNITKDILSKNI